LPYNVFVIFLSLAVSRTTRHSLSNSGSRSDFARQKISSRANHECILCPLVASGFYGNHIVQGRGTSRSLIW
jgi:hypothetical protein